VTDLPGWLKHSTVWLLLAAGVFLAVQAWQREQHTSQFVMNAGTLEIKRAADGHYHWPGQLAGPTSKTPVDFLVDTGATSTAIPLALARELGLQEVGRVQSNTAGGVVEGRVVLVDLVLSGGVQAQRLRVAALPDLQAPLLGMDVLGRLRWSQEQGVMRVERVEQAGRLEPAAVPR
jgi:aspartyl protease family protein